LPLVASSSEPPPKVSRDGKLHRDQSEYSDSRKNSKSLRSAAIKMPCADKLPFVCNQPETRKFLIVLLRAKNRAVAQKVIMPVYFLGARL
jgi:hypothetical protein